MGTIKKNNCAVVMCVVLCWTVEAQNGVLPGDRPEAAHSFPAAESPQPVPRRPPHQHRQADADPVLLCYYGSWAVYRPGNGKFDVEDIDPFLCTHVAYAFAGLQGAKVISLDPYNDLDDNYGRGGYRRFVALKKINPDLKTLLSLGGWNEGSTKYSQMVSTNNSRSDFIKSSVKFLLKFGFDGLDIDWEYPGQRGGRPEDKAHFGMLLEEMRPVYSQYNLLITAAVSPGKPIIDAGYDVKALARNLDLINLMAYEFHGSWEHYAHHHSPLYAYSQDKGPNARLNVDYAVRYWLGLGLPREQLVVGVGTFGRCFTLADPRQHQPYSPAPQPGRPGPYTRAPGVLGFNEICESEDRESWTVVRDKRMVAPYAFLQRQWCGYDDPKSATVKAQYMLSLGLAGAMVWSVDTEDFHGSCHGAWPPNTTFPVLTAIRTTLNGGQPIPTPTPEPIPTPTTPPDTTTTEPPPTPPPSGPCHREGLNADPARDCTVFYLCHQIADVWEWWRFHCAPGTVFVEELQGCDYPENHPACPLLPPVTHVPTTKEPATNLPSDSPELLETEQPTTNNPKTTEQPETDIFTTELPTTDPTTTELHTTEPTTTELPTTEPLTNDVQYQLFHEPRPTTKSTAPLSLTTPLSASLLGNSFHQRDSHPLRSLISHHKASSHFPSSHQHHRSSQHSNQQNQEPVQMPTFTSLLPFSNSLVTDAKDGLGFSHRNMKKGKSRQEKRRKEHSLLKNVIF